MNLILDALEKSDRAALDPHLRPFKFIQSDVLFEAGEAVKGCYFPYDAVVSIVVVLSTGESIEAAMVGRDGVVGVSAALDGKISLSRAIVQIGGVGVMCGVDQMRTTAMQSSAILSLLIRHEQTLYAQAQQSAACNVTHALEPRLARWLLRARDLAGSDMLPFTQEYLAEMLGVRRASVSLVAHTLQQVGMIKYSRGKIQIMNLEALQETACECYETVRSHYAAQFG